MLALSTIWNAHRHTDGERLLDEIRDLGVPGVELGIGLKPCLLAGLRRVLQHGHLNAVSARHPFPIPLEVASSGKPAREEPLLPAQAGARSLALRRARQTLEFAADFGARVVVLELGRVAMGLTAPLSRLAGRSRLHSRRYVEKKLAAIRRRDRVVPQVLSEARLALQELVPHAQAQGIRLALTSRAGVEEIPNEQELETLLDEFQDTGAIGYWHDFARVQAKANLGFLDHDQWLRRMEPFLIGCQVHDLLWPDTFGVLPFTGMIDFPDLLPLLPAGVPLVWNVPPGQPLPDLRQALAAWDERCPATA